MASSTDPIGTPAMEKEGTLSLSGTKTQRFEPIRTYTMRDTDYQFTEAETPNLAKIASFLGSMVSRGAETERTEELKRKDTVASMELSDPRVDPNDPAFNFFLWARMFLRLLEEDGIKRRRAGFTFKDLKVSGTGAALQLQSTVGSTLMA